MLDFVDTRGNVMAALKLRQRRPTGQLTARPVGIVDIGSNSVRLVVYEGEKRSPALIFNEKVQCGLGRSVARNGRLEGEAQERALRALRRFCAIARAIGVARLHAIATAAVRDAADGDAFIEQAETELKDSIEVLSGEREAQLAAYGVASGFPGADGIVGDLGGGSLELIDTQSECANRWVTLPLGGLNLQTSSGGDLKKARQITDAALADVDWLKEAMNGRAFFAVGGTWRAIARLHMASINYPLRVLQQYEMAAGEIRKFARELQESPLETFAGIEEVSPSRRETVAVGAVVLERLLKFGKPVSVKMSAQGVREGLLFGLMDQNLRQTDPLISTCLDLADERALSGAYARELREWTDRLFDIVFPEETPDQRRNRHAACLISDIGWRVHPAYRGEQSINLMENGAFSGVDHFGRAFVSLAVYYRHEGLIKDEQVERLKQLVVGDMRQRARALGALLRLAHAICGGEAGLIQGATFAVNEQALVLQLSRKLADFNGERVARRLASLARELKREPRIEVQ